MKKKLEHIWYYYKWYFVGTAMILSILLSFISERAAMVTPDWSVGLVTARYVPEEERQALAARFSELLEDMDGDGSVLVHIRYYQYDGNTMQTDDTAAFMAAAVQLAADLKNRESAWFLTDEPGLLLDADDTLREFTPPELTEFATVEDFTLLGRE